LAFTTVTGSNGVTSLVGTTGIDTATLVTLDSNVFIGANTGDDTITTALGTGGNNISGMNARLGGGDDTFTQGDTILNSFISLDGETLANDGNDTFTAGGATNLIINSEIVGRGGNDDIGATGAGLFLSGSTVNGNTGLDDIFIDQSSASFVYGGAETDTITVEGASTALLVNGNKGSDIIAVNAVAFSGGSVYGGAGNDIITMNSTTDGVLVSGDKGIDTINTSDGDDTVNGGEEGDTINTGAGTDTIDGGSGDDTIDAGAGDDTIAGGAGDDTITGGDDADVIDGGAGSDTFVLTDLTDSVLGAASGDDSNEGFDTISNVVWNTGAVGSRNGDMLDLTTGDGAAVDAIQVVTAGADLGSTLSTVTGIAAGDIARVTITGVSSFSGNYLIIDDASAASAGFDFATDAVIKVNTLAGLTTDAIV